jgi:hypothetical protein
MRGRAGERRDEGCEAVLQGILLAGSDPKPTTAGRIDRTRARDLDAAGAKGIS